MESLWLHCYGDVKEKLDGEKKFSVKGDETFISRSFTENLFVAQNQVCVMILRNGLFVCSLVFVLLWYVVGG